MRQLELLAPAKNLTCGIAAIDHGADAVYIGAHRFGARAAAGNSVDDIAQLCRYAHLFHARVYVTVNTILYDNELSDTRRLLEDLAHAGVDAILVQDMGILSLNSETNLPLHASTQTDNRTPEKVRWLRDHGFSRVVLARELSIVEIAEIHRKVPDVELEVFVHGALCVSYSGLCYASQHCFGRSANRGECAQFCRMKFDLIDADGQTIEHQRHLLSLKDMNRSSLLEQLAEAGAISFKIEGRLKDLDYVKNVTAAYSQQLNELVARHPHQYCRASKGRVTYTFKPDLTKTFNRGYTTYFAKGRQHDIVSFDTPKAVGEYVGYVKEIRGNSFNVAGTATFANGDGLCFLNEKRELEGFRVNKVENNRLFPLKMPVALQRGTRLYRNSDQDFQRQLSKTSAERKISIDMSLRAVDSGFELKMNGVTVTIEAPHQQAEKPQRENIMRQLTKLGGTPFECTHVQMAPDFNYFMPNSLLSELRRKAVQELLEKEWEHKREEKSRPLTSIQPFSFPSYTYLLNISNRLSRQFYQSEGLDAPAPAFELKTPSQPLIMQCRHCLRYALGHCVKHGGSKPDWHEPLCLKLADGRQFLIEFDCVQCQMNIYSMHNS